MNKDCGCNKIEPSVAATIAAVGALTLASMQRHGSKSENLETVIIAGREYHAPPDLAEKIRSAIEHFSNKGEFPPPNPRGMANWLNERFAEQIGRMNRPKATSWEIKQAKDELEHLSNMKLAYETLRNSVGAAIRMMEDPIQNGMMITYHGDHPHPVAPWMRPGTRWEVLYVGVDKCASLLPLDSASRRRNNLGVSKIEMAAIRTLLAHRKADGSALMTIERFR